MSFWHFGTSGMGKIVFWKISRTSYKMDQFKEKKQVIKVLFICHGSIYRAWWKVSYRLISPVFKRFLCFNLKFTKDLPIFLESQTCKKMSQNEEIKNMSELKPRITENGIDYILKEISRLQKQSPIWRSWILPILSRFLPLFINCLRITEYLYLRHSTPVL